MPNKKIQKKISKKLIIYIILFSSMITAIITLIQLYQQYSEDKSILDSNIKNINTGYRNGITNAVWLDDKVQLSAILNGVVALPDIEYIEVRVNGKIYASRGESVNSNSLKSSFLLHREHDNRMLTIGETFVEADLSGIYHRVLSRAWAILGLNAIKTFIVAIFMYFIFDRLVVTRLENLASFVRRFDIRSIGDGDTVVPIVDNKYSDEITDIVTALNWLQTHLLQSIKELLGLKKTLDLTRDGIIMFYPDSYRIFYVNAGATTLLGYTASELENMTPMDFCADLTESLFTKLATPDKNDSSQAMDIVTHFQPKQGRDIPVRLVLQYLEPENESPRFVFMARDISERIRAEREIRTSLDEAKAANAELESFSYSISHDLRAPLRSIDGFSLLLLQDYGVKIDEEGKDYINRVRMNAQYMGLLIDDLLSLSQVTRGELNCKVHNLSEMAVSAIKKLKDLEPERQISVTIAPDILGWVDGSLFQNLLDNLIGNAWKYTAKSKDPEIEFGTLSQDNKTVYFVRDNGAGFDMRYSNKLFNAFQRLHENEEFSGTGIGLATVSRILSRHGGRVWAEAEIGKGATFYFTLGSENELADKQNYSNS